MNAPRTPGQRAASAEERAYLSWYQRTVDHAGAPFDPAVLADLARAQHPSLPHLAQALARCTAIWPRDALYSYFLSYQHRKRHWHFLFSFPLHHPVLGDLIVDAVRDPRQPERMAIGGVEYLSRAMGRLPGVDPAITLLNLHAPRPRA